MPYSHLQNVLNDGIAEFQQSNQKYPIQLYQPISYILALGGKRLRPLLTLISSDLYNVKPEESKHAALAVELFHNFSLIHDDIMDKAPLRRGEQTVHEKWNTNIAILSGDAMLVKAYEQLAFYQNDLQQLLTLFNRTAVEVCEGQQYDMNFETQSHVSIDEYLNMIRLKTAVLLGCSLQIGSIIAKASEEDQGHLYEFGVEIGLAFQIKDDLLDVFGNPEKFGKLLGGDIISNKKTFLYLTALENANEEQKSKLNVLFETRVFIAEQKVKAVIEIYNELNIKSLVQTQIDIHFENALQHLHKVNCDATKKKNLLAFANALMERES